MKNKKLIAATKSFLEAIKKQDRPITFQDVLEFNRVHNPELYNEYMEALAEKELSQRAVERLKK